MRKKTGTTPLLILSFGAMIGLLIIIGGYALFQMNTLSRITIRMHRHPLTVSNAVRDANINILKIRSAVADAFRREDRDQSGGLQTVRLMDEASGRVEAGFALVRERFLGDKSRVNNAVTRYQTWKITQKKIIGLLQAGRDTEAREIITGIGSVQQKQLDAAMKELTDFASGKADDFLKTANRTRLVTAIVLGILIFLALGIAGTIAVIVVLRIRRLLSEARSVIEGTSEQIVETVTHQEQASAEQASAIQQVTTTMSELERTAEETTRRVKEAVDALERAGELGKTSGGMVTRLLGTMNNIKTQVDAVAEKTARLSEYSIRISGIAALVSDVSEQTGLLALNAAIEAVRAGEKGKGFGVVASEIRKLADESSNSADQINEQVQEITRAIHDAASAMTKGKDIVDNGTELVADAGSAFQDLASYNETVLEAVNQMTHSAREQSVAVGEVLHAMNTISEGAMETTKGLARTRADIRELMDGLKL